VAHGPPDELARRLPPASRTAACLAETLRAEAARKRPRR